MQNEETQEIALDSNEETVEETTTDTVEDTTDWKAEALKARAILARQKKSKPLTNVQEIPKPSDILKADEFKLYRQGYSETDIDLIMHNGGMKILEDKNNPLVLGLQASREQRKAEDAASKVTESSGLSDIERKYTETDLRKMSKEDIEKLLPHTD